MDFQQGLISTVHDYSLGNLDAVAFNQELSQRPTTLLIPCLMEEFSRPALGLIRDTLSGLTGLNELVVALAKGGCDTAAKTNVGQTGLLLAAGSGSAATLRAVLEVGGSELEAKQQDSGATAFLWSCFKGNAESVTMLAAG